MFTLVTQAWLVSKRFLFLFLYHYERSNDVSDILNELKNHQVWLDFLNYKLDKQHLSRKDAKRLTDFVNNKEYKSITDRITNSDFCFNPPIKRSINKTGTTKKRVIYTYNEAESMVLKVITFLLYRYDHKISDNCYSFRKNISARTAINKIIMTEDINNLYCLKLDISNYFNSIPADNLCVILDKFISDDPCLCEFLKNLLLADIAIEDGVQIRENRGAMAGTPISPFLANIYLSALDNHYSDIPYFRYSDDIIIFLPDLESCRINLEFIKKYLRLNGLSLNEDKVSIIKPHETWEFLGISYKEGVIDLSNITKTKIQAKIKRKAHALYRWRLRKDATFEQTAKVFIRVFNKKFFDETDENSFTWSRWFFPMINTDITLKKIDDYLIQYIRYLYKGRHYKGNYKITYEQIKALGFRSLVNEYYKTK